MRIVGLLVVLVSPVAAGEISRENLERHVRALASAEFEGRKFRGARKAEAYIVAELRKLGLEPVVREHAGVVGTKCRNVAVVLRAGEEPAPEHVILSAHYDHLGIYRGRLYPGASDNAAGVAALLELARLVKPPEGRDVLLLFFDQEEFGFVGSRAYCDRPLRPLEECAAFLTMDILGCDIADATEGLLFCVGLERSDTLFPAIDAVERPEGLDLVFAGADIVGSRSDYVPFRDREVPFVFFSAGESLVYHTPEDTAARLDFAKLTRETRLVRRAAEAIVKAPRPKWLKEPACRIAEVAGLGRAVAQLLRDPRKLGLSPMEEGLARGFLASLERVRESGEVARAERRQLVSVCRNLMAMLQGKR